MEEEREVGKYGRDLACFDQNFSPPPTPSPTRQQQLPTPMATGRTLHEYIDVEFARLEAAAHKRTDVVVGLVKDRAAGSVAKLRRAGAEVVAAKRTAEADGVAGGQKN